MRTIIIIAVTTKQVECRSVMNLGKGRELQLG